MNLSTEFPVLANCTYLNTAYSGILSTAVSSWRRAHDEDFLQRGSSFRLNQAEFIAHIRRHLSRFFKAEVNNTFLVPNFSVGFNTFLDGLSGDYRFLLVENDYPSVNYPVESRAYKVAYAAQNEHLEQNILDKVKEFKPDILALSLVQYTTGVKIDFQFLKELKAAYSDLLIVADGTQFCGTANFNFEGSALDVLISSSYKWMLGGYGNAFVLIKSKVRDFLYQQQMRRPLPAEPFLADKDVLALCFEPGHLDTLNFGTLQQSMLFLEQFGLEEIEKRIGALAGAAKAAFTARGLLSPAVVKRDLHSSIFNIKADAKLIEAITAANVSAAQRGEGLRVSFHFYNTAQDLEKLLKIIDRK